MFLLLKGLEGGAGWNGNLGSCLCKIGNADKGISAKYNMN